MLLHTRPPHLEQLNKEAGAQEKHAAASGPELISRKSWTIWSTSEGSSFIVCVTKSDSLHGDSSQALTYYWWLFINWRDRGQHHSDSPFNSCFITTDLSFCLENSFLDILTYREACFSLAICFCCRLVYRGTFSSSTKPHAGWQKGWHTIYSILTLVVFLHVSISSVPLPPSLS